MKISLGNKFVYGEISLVAIDQHTQRFVQEAFSEQYKCNIVDIEVITDSRSPLDWLQSQLIIVGCEVRDPVRLAQILHKKHYQGAVLILVKPDDYGVLNQRLIMTPIIGKQTRAFSMEGTQHLLAAIRQTLSKTLQKRQYGELIGVTRKQFSRLELSYSKVSTYLERLLDHAPIGVLIINHAREIVEINAKGKEIFDISNGSDKTDILNVAFRERLSIFEEMIASVTAGRQKTSAGTIEIETCKGSIKSTEILLSKLSDESDQTLMMIVQDVTQRVTAERELNLAIKSLKDVDELKDQFMSTISHELLTPINGLRLSMSLLKGMVDDNAFEFLNDADSSSQHLQGLVESMITFTDARRGDLRMRSEPFEFISFLETLFRYFKENSATEIDYRLNCHSSTPRWIIGDKTKMSIIINELMKNASTFTRVGEVELSSFVEEEQSGVQQLTLTVTDTGPGISDTLQNTIFEAFRQADGSFTREHGGLGIGLTNIRDILHIMGGELSLVSSPKRGSCFSVNIPLLIPSDKQVENIIRERGELQRKEIVGKQGAEKAKILVVEDNEVNRRLLVKLLDKLGYVTLSAVHGKEALQLLKGNADIAAILMDCQMPIMDGYEATRKIRRIYEFKTLPIIAVTANVSEADQQRCRDSGMSDFLSKPASKALITNMLNKWLIPAEK